MRETFDKVKRQRGARFVGAIVVLVCFVLMSGPGYSATQKHALVIANSEYAGEYRLNNPVKDAEAISNTLKMMGYKLYGGRVYDQLDLSSTSQTVNDFFTGVPDGAHTLVYYAGHGVSLENQNFLIPILPEGVALENPIDVKNRTYSLQAMLDEAGYSNPSGVNVMLIDACRDAPVNFAYRSVNMLEGMSPIDSRTQPKGTFVGFSTEYGKVALDGGNDGYSPYAEELLYGLQNQASLPIEIFHKNLADRVYKRTSGKQYPIYEPKIRGEFCLVSCEALTQPTIDGLTKYGVLNISTYPEDAEVCFRGNDGWDCDRNISRRPVGETLLIRVSAKGYESNQISTVIDDSIQDINVVLRKTPMATKTKVGIGLGVALLLAVIAGSADSGGGEGNQFGITLNPPQ
jgi:hypothetical protein